MIAEQKERLNHLIQWGPADLKELQEYFRLMAYDSTDRMRQSESTGAKDYHATRASVWHAAGDVVAALMDKRGDL